MQWPWTTLGVGWGGGNPSADCNMQIRAAVTIRVRWGALTFHLPNATFDLCIRPTWALQSANAFFRQRCQFHLYNDIDPLLQRGRLMRGGGGGVEKGGGVTRPRPLVMRRVLQEKGRSLVRADQWADSKSDSSALICHHRSGDPAIRRRENSWIDD